MKKVEKVMNKMTIVSSLAQVVNEVRNSGLEQPFWENCRNALDFLQKALQMTDMQIIILSILVERGAPMSWRSLGEFVGVNRLEMMTYTEEIEELLKRRWLVRSAEHDFDRCFEAIALAYGVVTALRHNKPFVPEKLHDLTVQQLVDKLETKVELYDDDRCDARDLEDYVMQLCELNKELPLCKQALRYNRFEHGTIMFMYIVADYASHGDTPQHGVSINRLSKMLPYSPSFRQRNFSMHLQSGNHPLLQLGKYVEFKCEDGIANTGTLVLSRKAINNLLQGYQPSMSGYVENSISNALISHTSIKPKEMFYNIEDKTSIDTLTRLLDPEQFKQVQQRLVEQGHRKGFGILFYGAPGTGKTETVKQIARLTGRDIMLVDIASMRDKYVGETEKNIKAVFTNYRNECRNSEVAPILVFNEADGIFGKRFANTTHSVEKMENAMQNIILQEMENLEGILIATTNLTTTLDGAFERRFIFKVNFHTPNVEVKTKLWRSMMGNLINKKEALALAEQFDFSGGQIENISRKCSVHYVVYGNKPSFSEIEGFCNEELIGKQSLQHVGFRA